VYVVFEMKKREEEAGEEEPTEPGGEKQRNWEREEMEEECEIPVYM